MKRIFALILFVLFLPSLSWAQPLERPAAMAPLVVEDWEGFKRDLKRAKEIGITAISTDVWWGKVEGAGDQQFDWGYYDSVSSVIIEHGLKWVPILSFHQCGGNVGDDCDIPIPGWLWGQLGGDDPNQLKYKSEKGNYSTEVIALWADDRAREEYVEFIAAFRDRYNNKAQHIEEINVGAGPSGELRYPSYNSHDGFNYPARGFLQAYSKPALEDFRTYAKAKYATLERISAAWNIDPALSDWSQVRPPSNADEFFGLRDYLHIQYGKDFTDWYNGALVKHGAFMIELALETLGDSFPGVPLGIKIPGVHWQISSPAIPRSAEVTAGLIPTNLDLFEEHTAHCYAPILDMIQRASTNKRQVVLHFTCLEMDNEPGHPNYSEAKNLVFWVAQGASNAGVEIMGENALSGGVMNDHGWDNIDNAVRWSDYRGLTTLRVGNLAANDGLGFHRYQRLINDFKPN